MNSVQIKKISTDCWQIIAGNINRIILFGFSPSLVPRPSSLF